VKLALTLRINGTRVPAEVELDADALAQIAEQVAPRPWPEWMNADTAAAYLDTTRSALWHMKRAGLIPYVQDEPNGRVFFNRTDIDRALKERTEQ
jgi:hypothetical protein